MRKTSPSDQRRRERRALDQIHGKARQRQRAWLETDQPFLTGRLTVELDDLYGDVRDERSGKGTP
jgi:hypothetical protein